MGATSDPHIRRRSWATAANRAEEGQRSMLDHREILASDTERQQIVLRLHDACGEGRLTLDEFSDRVKLVFASRTRGELLAIIADLPKSTSVAPSLPAPTDFTLALLSKTKRKGRWSLKGGTTAIAILGSCTLDLRQATIHGQEVVIDTYAVLGSLKVIVRPGTAVDLGGFAILGSRDTKVEDDPNPGSPVVRIRGLALLGSVDVVTRERIEPEAATRPEPRVSRPELLES